MIVPFVQETEPREIDIQDAAWFYSGDDALLVSGLARASSGACGRATSTL
jgi:hypothetical protein